MIGIGITGSINIKADGSFIPSKIPTLNTWFEAFDTSTIIESSNLVSQWNDKSSNSYNATQGDSARQPLTNTSTLNGNNVLDYNADRLLLPSGVYGLTNSANTTVTVAKSNDVSGVKILYAYTNGATLYNTVYYNSSDQVVYKNSTGGGDLTASGVAINDYNVIVCTFDGTNTQTIYVNGVQLAQNTSGSANSGVDGAAVGGTTSSGSFNGSIAFHASFTSELTTEERQNMEGYVAWKLEDIN